MGKDLTSSDIQRQNILNNRYALKSIESEFDFEGIAFNQERIFTKQQVASILEVDERTIDNYLSRHNDELSKNGYRLLKGSDLKTFKALLHVDENDFVDINPKIPQLGIFTFKTVLNLAMLADGEKARQIRSRILDITINTITKKAGNKKYINQRDIDYLPASFQEENYRKEFTNAIDSYIESNSKWKYAKYTNMVYQAIFEENALEYRKILDLKSHESVRDTFYAEVLDLIASFEAGFSESLRQESERLERALVTSEANEVFSKFSNQAAFRPLITKAKTIMASRDYSLRDSVHEKLEPYIQAMPEADYEKFLGEKSKDLEKRIDESIEVFKRLKDR